MAFFNALMLQTEVYDLLNELFLSIEIWGYFGPILLAIGGLVLTKKDKMLGLIAIIAQSLFIVTYLDMVTATPAYWWHSIILILGVIACAFQMLSK